MQENTDNCRSRQTDGQYGCRTILLTAGQHSHTQKELSCWNTANFRQLQVNTDKWTIQPTTDLHERSSFCDKCRTI